MHMRIIWGKILPGQWDAFEAAFKKALEIRGEAKGLKSQWHPRCPRHHPRHAVIGIRLTRTRRGIAAAAVAAATLALTACAGGAIAQSTPASNGQSFVSGMGGTTVFGSRNPPHAPRSAAPP